jgi:hypothetical protein
MTAMALSAIICTSLLPLAALAVRTQLVSRQVYTEGLQRWNAVQSALLAAPYSPDQVRLVDWELGPVHWTPPGEVGAVSDRNRNDGNRPRRTPAYAGDPKEVTP